MADNIYRSQEKPEVNWTDPIVWHDPTLDKEKIAKKYDPPKQSNNDEHLEDMPSIENVPEDQIKTEGIFFPIIQVNNTTVESHQIESIRLVYTGFVPTISVTINDIDGFIRFKDVPGINNILKLVIIPQKDGAYRKISLAFKITSYSVFGDELYYTGEYKLDDLYKDNFSSINFEGCGDCGQAKNPLPNTWEYLHYISNQLGLGFASTEKCKDIADNLPRLLQNISYEKFITNSIEYGGLDEKSIFDCWIDLYGYIVMVNLPYIFESEIKTFELELVSNLGMPVSQNGLPDYNITNIKRTLTNYSAQGAVSNINIESYVDESDPSEMYYGGNLHSLVTFMPAGNKGSNNLVSEDIESKEFSIDGDFVDEYKISKKLPVQSCFVGYNIKKQQDIREQYFNKIRLRRLEVILSEYNLGLQRGTLVNVMIFEEDIKKKSKLLQSSSNIFGEDKRQNVDTSLASESADDTGQAFEKDIQTQTGSSIINLAISGMYYIDGMEFTYERSEGKLVQKLILLKKGIRSNIDNKHTMVKIIRE